jgi:hypothetical protein
MYVHTAGSDGVYINTKSVALVSPMKQSAKPEHELYNRVTAYYEYVESIGQSGFIQTRNLRRPCVPIASFYFWLQGTYQRFQQGGRRAFESP